MSDLRTFQPAFTAGELSPALWARVDLAKYASGCKTAINLFIHAHGGASNRSGLEFIRETRNSDAKTKLVPFQFNTEQSYILEFGHGAFRVFRDGAIVLKDGAPYEVATSISHEHVESLVWAQEADVMYVCCAGLYPVYKISRLADDNWTIALVTFSPRTVSPTGLGGSAQFNRRTGETDSVTFVVTALSAGGAESAASAGVTVPVQWENEDGRRVRIIWAASAGAALYRVYRASGSSTGKVVETTSTLVDIAQGQINGDGSVIPGASAPGAPPVPTTVDAAIIFGQEMKYVVAAIDDQTGEESLPSAPFTLINDLAYQGNRNLLTWNGVAGASAYSVYKLRNGVYGYIGRTEATSFTDENISADVSNTPQTARNPFDGAGKYPRCLTFIEQRLAFASTLQDPQAVWLSQSANYENFGVSSSTAKASDAVTFRIKSKEVNEIRSMLPVKGLMLLTSGSEWTVSGGSQADAIAPNAIKIDNQGFRGAARVQPIVVGNTVLFAQERGGIIRDFSYEFASDGFTGKDLTVLARHLFEDRSIKAWAYAQAPHSIVWVVLDDGSLVSLTYMKEHDVWSWTRHQSGPDNDAIFEDVAVIGEGGRDAPYFVVGRTIGGVRKRYIERLHSRSFRVVEDAFFVDSGLTYEGPAKNIITGLDHLEGQQVVALSDGNVVRNLTVEGGAVTLPNPAQKAHVGLPMVASLQTLDLDLGQVSGLGTVQGRTKSVSEVTFRVDRTRGIFTGDRDGDRDSEHLVEYKQRETEAWNEPIRLYTGDIAITTQWDWNTHGNMWVKQFDPLPMTILAIMPDVTIGG